MAEGVDQQLLLWSLGIAAATGGVLETVRRLRQDVRQLQADLRRGLSGSRTTEAASHRLIWDRVNDHETRLSRLEGRNERSC